jgi:hypothetical protein
VVFQQSKVKKTSFSKFGFFKRETQKKQENRQGRETVTGAGTGNSDGGGNGGGNRKHLSPRATPGTPH